MAISITDVQRAVVDGIADALRMHGVNVPDSADDDSDDDSHR